MNFGVGNARHTIEICSRKWLIMQVADAAALGTCTYICTYLGRYDTDLPIYDTETYLLFHHLCMHPTLTQQLVHHSE